MNQSSANTSETTSQTGEGSDAATAGIAKRVALCASETSSRAEFLQRLAADISKTFGVAIVAVESTDWSGPMMLVANDGLAQDVSRESIRQLLASAAVVPIACDVELEIPSDAGNDRTRALRVELCQAPRRSAILLIYPADSSPSATEQLDALKQLSQYTRAIRDEIGQLPSGNQSMIVDSHASEATAAALRARHSLSQFHADLDLDATAYRIANESRRLLNCDRTTVLIQRGNRFRVRAISGVAVIDARSNSVKAAEDLVQRAAVMSRPLQLPSEEPLPPQIQEPLDVYLDETGVSTTMILPLHQPDTSDRAEEIDGVSSGAMLGTLEGTGDIVAIMMLEYFSAQPAAAVNQATSLVATEAMYSLRNALEHRNVFGLTVWKSVGNIVHSGKMPLISLGCAALACLLVLSMYIQIDHQVIATGSAQPTVQRQVFAAIDGVVKEIHVADGQLVAADEPLLTLENAELESRNESLLGELQTANKRLSSISAMRLSSATDASQAGRLAIEERQLRSEIQNLQSQQDLVRRQQDDLIIRSPIAGTVVGWQLNQRLSDRPITRGNLLMRVVDHAGEWSLKLKVPDNNAGPILDALNETHGLPIQFAIATDPDGSFSAELQSLATAARLDETGQHVIDAIANVPTEKQTPAIGDAAESQDRSLAGSHGISPTPQDKADRTPFDPTNVRIGADVTARIACGKRSVLRSWFSDAFDFVDRNVLFYFR